MTAGTNIDSICVFYLFLLIVQQIQETHILSFQNDCPISSGKSLAYDFSFQNEGNKNNSDFENINHRTIEDRSRGIVEI